MSAFVGATCPKFQLDLSKDFGTCKCGAKKAEHTDAAIAAGLTRDRRKPARVPSGGGRDDSNGDNDTKQADQQPEPGRRDSLSDNLRKEGNVFFKSALLLRR
jgi:hypothetical protein